MKHDLYSTPINSKGNLLNLLNSAAIKVWKAFTTYKATLTVIRKISTDLGGRAEVLLKIICEKRCCDFSCFQLLGSKTTNIPSRRLMRLVGYLLGQLIFITLTRQSLSIVHTHLINLEVPIWKFHDI